MSKPEQIHRTLKARGTRLSDFLKRELAHSAERPTMQEWLERTKDAKPIRTRRTPAQVIRDLRASR
jgi:hypothetical protein